MSFYRNSTAAIAAFVCGQALFAVPTLAETLGISLSDDSNPFYVQMRKGIEERATELGWTFTYVGANESVVNQIQTVEDFVAKGVDSILISPVDAVGAGPAYAAAAAVGIPIMSVARHAISPDQTMAIKMDEVGVGSAIGAWLVAKLDGKGKIAMIEGPSGAQTFRNIAQGFTTQIESASGIEVVARFEAPLRREEGLRITEDILTAHPDVQAIYCGNDETALGAVQAVAAAGKTGQIIITGMNATGPARAAVDSGGLALTVQLKPLEWGRLAVDSMAKWLGGDHTFEAPRPEFSLIEKQ